MLLWVTILKTSPRLIINLPVLLLIKLKHLSALLIFKIIGKMPLMLVCLLRSHESLGSLSHPPASAPHIFLPLLGAQNHVLHHSVTSFTKSRYVSDEQSHQTISIQKKAWGLNDLTKIKIVKWNKCYYCFITSDPNIITWQLSLLTWLNYSFYKFFCLSLKSIILLLIFSNQYAAFSDVLSHLNHSVKSQGCLVKYLNLNFP